MKPSIYGDDIKAPLLGKDGANTEATSVISDFRDSTTTIGSAAVKPTQSQLINLVAVGLVTTAALAASISALVLVSAPITIVTACICLLNSPMVMYKAKKLLVLPSLREKVDELQHTKKLLKRDMKKLKEEVKSLDAQKRRYVMRRCRCSSFAMLYLTPFSLYTTLMPAFVDMLVWKDNFSILHYLKEQASI